MFTNHLHRIKNKSNIFLIFAFTIYSLLTNAQDTLKISVTHGYKIKKEYWKQDKQLAKITGLTRKSIGGLRGGHVEIHLGNFVYGFTDIPNANIPHIFPREKKNLGLFTKKDSRKWQKNHSNDKITYFYIPIIKEQILMLQEKYESYTLKCPYDFALFGKRCASSCYEILMHFGILDKKSNLGVILAVFHPRKLRKILRRQALQRNIIMKVQEGLEQRKWDK